MSPMKGSKGRSFGRRLAWAAGALALMSAPAQAKTFYFSHSADGLGFSMVFFLTNTGISTATGILSAYDAAGTPQVLPFVTGAGAQISFSLPPGGVRVFSTDGTSSPARTGFVAVQTDQDSLAGTAVFKAPGFEAGVFPVAPGRKFAMFVERSAALDTGLAFVRLSEGTQINLTLSDTADRVVGVATLSFSGRKDARFLSEIFRSLPANFQGVLMMEAGGEFVPLGLRFGAAAFSTIPVIELAPSAPAPSILSVSPTSGNRGGTISNFTLTGTNFQADSTISFSGSGVIVLSYTSRTPTQIVATIAIAANAAPGARDVMVSNPDLQQGMRAGSFTVTQAEVCNYAISPTSQSLAAAGGTGSVSVTTQSTCAWTGASSADWITINSGNSGTGAGTVNFTVAANGSTSARTGTLTVAGQTFTVTQAGASCAYSLSATSQAFPSAGGSGSVFVTAQNDCSWTAVSNADWVTILSGGSGSGNGTVNFVLAATTSSRTGTMTIAGQTFTVSQSGTVTACSYSISRASQSFTSAGGTSSVAVTAGTGCAWTAVSNASWITIASGAGGSGNGTVTFTVASYAGSSSQTGTLIIAGQTFTVTQTGLSCIASVSPATLSLPGYSGTSVLTVTAASHCAWTAVSNVSWMTITSGFNGSGNGTVSLGIDQYPGASTVLTRTGTLTIAGQTVNATQTSVDCSGATVSPTSQAFNSVGGSGTVTVINNPASCAVTAASGDNWITVGSISGAAGGQAVGTVNINFTAAANTGAPRTGTISVSIGGEATPRGTFTVTQTGLCNNSISPTSQSFGLIGGSGAVAVTSPSYCNWTAVSNDSWITVTSSATGSGNGTVNYTVAAASASRVGTLSIAGQSFTVTQTGVSCSYSISPTSQSFTSAGGSGSVTVTAGSGCSWTAASNNSWITITSGASGSGNGTVNFSVAPYSGSTSQTGTLTIAGETFTVTQTGVSCAGSVSPSSLSPGGYPWSATLTVTAAGNCAWTASSNVGWITITSGFSGSGNGTVNVEVDQYPAGGTTLTRTGAVTIAGQTINVSQTSVDCSGANVSPASQSFGSSGGNGTASLIYFSVPQACAATVASNNSWITLGTIITNGNIISAAFTVSANAGAPRTGAISFTIKGEATPRGNLTVTQSGACSYSISPTSQTIALGGGSGSVAVTAPSYCAWTASSNDSWITITSSTGSGNGIVTYTVAAASTFRVGTLTVAGQTFTVTQGGACTYSISPATQAVPFGGGDVSTAVTFQAGCTWTAVSNVDWIYAGAPTGTNACNPYCTGTTFTAVVATNTGSASRTGTVTVAGQTLTVTQSGTAGTSCSYSISRTTWDIGSYGSTITVGANPRVDVTAPAGCAWVVFPKASWFYIYACPGCATIAQGGRSGSGSNAVQFFVNTTSSARTGTASIAGQTFTINQSGP